MKVTIDLQHASSFIAGLVREGVQFDAVQFEDKIVIKFTGGF